ncbi:siderophore-interacting protein [Pseudonocardia sp. H11422]|uniref:siderophore-interacting protein n=1 Tax=Pseudonocardia sp. H11422 TaxID=2835866 RepID=UPI001BDD4BA6|nr:siderophore-interacting protein [Pseudonocardia sp. H11422]
MARRLTSLEVQRTERLTPHMIRVVAGGDDLVEFPDTPYTDRYVKLVFPRPGVDYPEPLDMDAVRRDLPREQWPVTRTYTVRDFDPAARELTIDFVHHGDSGLAGPWAAAARPGDRLRLLGPGGAYAPRTDAGWHLLVGDEAALPAIGAALERIPAGVPALAVIEVADDAEHQHLRSPGDARITWVHRDATSPGQLVDTVRAIEFPPGQVHAFVHGEAGAVKQLRRHLIDERGVRREWLSISGYWRHGRDEDGFREDKAADRRVEEQATAS